jgi:hypothetical protein
VTTCDEVIDPEIVLVGAPFSNRNPVRRKGEGHNLPIPVM